MRKTNMSVMKSFDLFKDIPLTKEQREYVEDSGKYVTPAPGSEANAFKINQSRIMSELYLVKNLQKLVDKMIVSSEKHARRMAWFTGALAFFTGALVFVGIAQIVGALN